ncbi:MAG: hypothetical protein AB4911_11540 [Oscillochloridaceae bacterium umkhey_bin13]
MNNRPNWLGIGALVLAGLAVLIAMGGFFRSMMFDRTMAYGNAPMAQVQANPAAEPGRRGPPAFVYERFEGRNGGPPAFVRERFEDRNSGPPAKMRGNDHAHGAMMMGQRPGMHPLVMIFGLIDAVSKVVALGLLAWLLLKLYQQRQPAGPSGPAPTTPAGHDPRVE